MDMLIGRNQRPQGYAYSWDRQTGEMRKEADTITCAHCNGVVHLPVKADPNKDFGFCRMCMKATCARCQATGECKPFEKKLEEIEKTYHRRRMICEALGLEV
jgi:hypothetical protein